jgi:hypothetical protein
MNLKTVMRPPHGITGLLELCVDIDKKIGGKITIVEVGSFMGESAVIFADCFPNGKIYCIDPWLSGYDEKDSASDFDFNDVENQFDLRTKEFNNIFKIKTFSLDYFKECDAVYIDGLHTYEGIKNDIIHWLPQTKKVICGHDYYEDEEFLKIHPHVAGVKVAVDEMLGKPDKIYSDGSWLKWIK